MSEYIKQLKIQLASKIEGIRFQDISGLEVNLLKEGFPPIRVRDEKEYVIIAIGNNTYRYDKWYTKPEHLAETLKVFYQKQG
ncbi:MAG: hypothetical protein QXP02_04845 [Desulfurococcaceae archaeon]